MANFRPPCNIYDQQCICKPLSKVFGAPYCGTFWKIGALPKGPKWTNFKIFQSFIKQNPCRKGVIFKGKNVNSRILGPTMWTSLDILEDLPIGPQYNYLKILEQFLYKILIQGGLFLEKNCQPIYLRPHFAGHFENRGVCQLAQNGPIKKLFNFFLHQTHNKKGVCLMKKLPTHIFGALQWGRFWANVGIDQSAQIGPILTLRKIFLYKI